jgi:His/Glu/Gln/Arg/opine family amino acid ABC transporter permease subunit
VKLSKICNDLRLLSSGPGPGSTKFDLGIFVQQLVNPSYLNGALLSVSVAVLALIPATGIGFAVALGRTSNSRIAQGSASFYTWFFHAIPALLVLLIIWNALPQLFPVLRQDWFTPFIAAFIGLGIVEAAFMAEIIRSALLSVDDGQKLAGWALGMSPAKVMLKVVMPQAIRIAGIGYRFSWHRNCRYFRAWAVLLDGCLHRFLVGTGVPGHRADQGGWCA